MRGETPNPKERRVVLDTNVLVSAFLTPNGHPHTIVQAVLDSELVLAYSDAIMAEYRSVLARPRFGFDAQDVSDVLAFIETFGEYTSITPSETPMLDESDRPFLDTGEAANATLVTGNAKHYPPSDRLMAPAEFVRTQLT